MKNILILLSTLFVLLLSGCSTEDWNRLDQRFSKVSFDIISEPDPYADQYHEADEQEEKE